MCYQFLNFSLNPIQLHQSPQSWNHQSLSSYLPQYLTLERGLWEATSPCNFRRRLMCVWMERRASSLGVFIIRPHLHLISQTSVTKQHKYVKCAHHPKTWPLAMCCFLFLLFHEQAMWIATRRLLPCHCPRTKLVWTLGPKSTRVCDINIILWNLRLQFRWIS